VAVLPLERAPDQLLVVPPPVRVRGVEEVQPEIDMQASPSAETASVLWPSSRCSIGDSPSGPGLTPSPAPRRARARAPPS
jgi:hypothetical protein